MTGAMDELLDLVDQEGHVVGTAPRSQCHGNPALRHQTVHVVIRSSRGQILLQKRRLDRDVQPGKWDTAVGGHLQHGETPLQGAYREYAEEVGHPPVSPLRHLFQMNLENAYETELTQVYVTVDDGPFSPQPEELEQLKFWTPQELQQLRNRHLLTPYLEQELTLLSKALA